MKKILCATAIIVATCACLYTPARAIAIGPRIGYYRTVDADEGDLLYGAAVRAKLLTYLGIEGSVDYRQDSFGVEDGLTVRSWPIQVTGMVYPVPVLYGALGAGWYNTTFDYDPDVFTTRDETTNNFGWHVGGGLELPLGEFAAVAADVRYVFLNLDFQELPEVPQRDSDFYMMSIGLLFGTP